ncbi:MAG: CocE/NonD family hydrolase C-terminal non-catalytic domain-containing protein [Acidimicrobiales bacterium]
MREPSGALVAWTSPGKHIPMEVAAAYAEWPWDDLANALAPNGRLLTATYTPPADDIAPVGVEKQSWDDLLYFGSAAFHLAPVGSDPSADVTGWFDDISKGEPYGASDTAFLEQIQQYHSPIGIPIPAGGPPPTVIQNGWTDTLFPVSEALHYADRLVAAGTRSPLFMIFDDVGHGWAQNKAADVLVQTAKAIAFLNAVMLHHSSPASGVLAIGTTCPASAPSGPTLQGATFSSLQAGSLSFGSAAAQTVTSSGGSDAVANALDPAVGSPYCHELRGKRERGTAVYQLALSRATTVVGGLLVHAEVQVRGDYPELVGRLWDLDNRNGKRQLIEAGVLRLSVDESAGSSAKSEGSQPVTLELAPNLYTVAAGHSLELELVGSTAPWFRASNGTFRITVTALTATIGLAKETT